VVELAETAGVALLQGAVSPVLLGQKHRHRALWWVCSVLQTGWMAAILVRVITRAVV
jgi:hypothetical protein